MIGVYTEYPMRGSLPFVCFVVTLEAPAAATIDIVSREEEEMGDTSSPHHLPAFFSLPFPDFRHYRAVSARWLQ